MSNLSFIYFLIIIVIDLLKIAKVIDPKVNKTYSAITLWMLVLSILTMLVDIVYVSPYWFKNEDKWDDL